MLQKTIGMPKRLLEKYHGPLFMLAIVILGLVARWQFIPFESFDMYECLIPWYGHIKALGGLATLDNLPGNYTPPYLILMALFTYTPLKPIMAIKLINMAGDIFLALPVYALARHMLDANRARYAFAITFLLPTVVLNSSVWGQCDAIFTGFLVLMLLFYCKDKPYLSMVMYGLAVAFKQQALFLAPLVVVLVVAGRIRLREALVSIAAYIVPFLPSILQGDSVNILWRIYANQAGLNPYETVLNIANLYTWYDYTDAVNELFAPGYLYMGLAVVGVFCYWLWQHREDLDKPALLGAALFLAILIPYALPHMHDRYYFIADILSVVFVLMLPGRWYVAVLCELVSLCCYVPFLFHIDPPLPLEWLALLPLVSLAAVGFTLRARFAASRAARLAPEADAAIIE